MSQWAWLPLFLRGLSDTVFSLTCGWRDGKNEWAGDQEIWASYRFGHRGVMMEEAVRMLSHGVNHTSMERRECHHALGLELTFLCSGPAEWFGTLIQHTAVRKTLKLHRVMNGIFSNVMGNLWMEWELSLVPKCSLFTLQHSNGLGLREQHFFSLSSHYDGG